MLLLSEVLKLLLVLTVIPRLGDDAVLRALDRRGVRAVPRAIVRGHRAAPRPLNRPGAGAVRVLMIVQVLVQFRVLSSVQKVLLLRVLLIAEVLTLLLVLLLVVLVHAHVSLF